MRRPQGFLSGRLSGVGAKEPLWPPTGDQGVACIRTPESVRKGDQGVACNLRFHNGLYFLRIYRTEITRTIGKPIPAKTPACRLFAAF